MTFAQQSPSSKEFIINTSSDLPLKTVVETTALGQQIIIAKTNLRYKITPTMQTRLSFNKRNLNKRLKSGKLLFKANKKNLSKIIMRKTTY